MFGGRYFKTFQSYPQMFYGLFTWREEDSASWKILEGKTTFCLVYTQKFRSGYLTSGEETYDEIVGL